MSTPVLRALAGKPGAAKRALQEQYGESTSADLSGDGALTKPCHISPQACLTPLCMPDAGCLMLGCVEAVCLCPSVLLC